MNIDKLTFKRGNDVILDDISFSLCPGIVNIIGQNGSGKSTLIKLIENHNNVDQINVSGAVTIVSEYVCMPLDIPIKFIFNENSHLARKSKFAEFETFFVENENKKGSQLSTGERRLFEVFFSLSTDARVIIFDEATNGLDKRNLDLIIKMLRTFDDKNKIIVFVTHHLDEYVKVKANANLFLQDGKIIEKEEISEDDLIDFMYKGGFDV